MDNAARRSLDVLKADCTFGSESLYPQLARLAKQGKIGAVKTVPNMARVDADAFHGDKVRMKNWLQVSRPIVADFQVDD